MEVLRPQAPEELEIPHQLLHRRAITAVLVPVQQDQQKTVAVAGAALRQLVQLAVGPPTLLAAMVETARRRPFPVRL